MSWVLRFGLSHIQSGASCDIAWCRILYISVATSIDWHHSFVGSPESILVLCSIFSIVRICVSAFPFSHDEYDPIICRSHWNSLWIMSQNLLDLASSPPWSVLIIVTVLFCSSSWRRKKLTLSNSGGLLCVQNIYIFLDFAHTANKMQVNPLIHIPFRK